MNEIDVLIYLGKMGAFNEPITLTTSKMGRELGENQQNASRWLIKMESSGLICRKSGVRGYIVQITPDGEKALRDMRAKIDLALNNKEKIIIKGRAVTGIGDGKYYMGLDSYSSKIKEYFGFKPFKGTLNIKLIDMTAIRHKESICAKEGLVIDGFTIGERIFGSLKCFRCSLKEAECVLIIPERSHHSFDILEIISELNLRKIMGIKDGDEIAIEVNLNENI